jgi:phytoene dehydrogenase-like protein
VTFFNLVKEPQKVLPKPTYNKLKNIEYNGAATKLNIALKKLPKFKAFKNHPLSAEKLLQGTIHINCESMDQLKTAFEQTMTERMSLNPFMDITIPSIFDKTMCPEGYFIMNCLLQYTPYHPNIPKALAKPGPIPHSMIK